MSPTVAEALDRIDDTRKRGARRATRVWVMIAIVVLLVLMAPFLLADIFGWLAESASLRGDVDQAVKYQTFAYGFLHPKVAKEALALSALGMGGLPANSECRSIESQSTALLLMDIPPLMKSGLYQARAVCESEDAASESRVEIRASLSARALADYKQSAAVNPYDQNPSSPDATLRYFLDARQALQAGDTMTTRALLREVAAVHPELLTRIATYKMFQSLAPYVPAARSTIK